jgi:hypothetical protein
VQPEHSTLFSCACHRPLPSSSAERAEAHMSASAAAAAAAAQIAAGAHMSCDPCLRSRLPAPAPAAPPRPRCPRTQLGRQQTESKMARHIHRSRTSISAGHRGRVGSASSSKQEDPGRFQGSLERNHAGLQSTQDIGGVGGCSILVQQVCNPRCRQFQCRALGFFFLF